MDTENVEFCNLTAIDGASYASDQYRTLIGNRIRRIEWYHLQALWLPVKYPK